MEYIIVGLLIALVASIWKLANVIDNGQHLAAQERDAINALHAAQLSELCNRIQEPERAARVSIHSGAEPAPEFVHPDIEFERALSE